MRKKDDIGLKCFITTMTIMIFCGLLSLMWSNQSTLLIIISSICLFAGIVVFWTIDFADSKEDSKKV